MKFVSFINKNIPSYGILIDDSKKIVDINKLSINEFPTDMLTFLQNFDVNLKIITKILNDRIVNEAICSINSVELCAPILNPTSFRDAYAFRKHVEAGRKNRGLEMIAEYDKFPVFYFSNHNSISGPGDVYVQKKHLNKLDFEFEIAIVIGKKGINISSSNAYKYVAGFLIMNDWSARFMQFEEMKLNLGPAKGKDFATSIGPFLVTLNELEENLVTNKNNLLYNLEMKGYVNDKLVSQDNLKEMSWSFADIIERASYGVELIPGDIIGSGTCATGCFLELNLTNNTDVWLKDGDVVELHVDKLGVLKNTIKLK